MSEELPPFNEREIRQLTSALHRGAAEASAALGTWLSAAMSMSIESVDQCPLANATEILGDGDAPVCMCLMRMQGGLTGEMLLAFDDASGLFLTDLLLDQAPGTATTWGQIETSSAQETMNIAGSAYLNGIARDLSERGTARLELVPTPPAFLRDFQESLLETAFMDQALVGSWIVFARAKFELQGQPIRWTFLLIPDPASLKRLSELLAGRS